MVYRKPVKRVLLTWSDRGVDGPVPAHTGARPRSDRGPVLRLLEESDGTYDAAFVLTVPKGARLARALAEEMGAHVGRVDVVPVELEDPSDYGALFTRVAPVCERIAERFPRSRASFDVLLSAGTPQAQTIWVILVQSALLHARMLQVIPAAFVPVPHPRAVREVSLDIEGFPEIRALRAEVSRLRAEAGVRRAKLVAESEPMRELLSRVVRVAKSDLPVLVLGETGVGKELIARAIHDGSPRANGPFVAENCGAFAESILASELFGHEAGAFTGARGIHRGLFEQAHGGTIFLDEVGELPAKVQTMLLRVLQEGTLRRVGGEKPVRVDVRVVAATHRDLEKLVKRGRFREDLYYRLRGATLVVPPLRDRARDIPPMIAAFLEEAEGNRARKLSVTPAAMRVLAAHLWPGNVRELRSEVQRWMVFCDRIVDVGDLAPDIVAGAREAGVEPPAPPRGGSKNVASASRTDVPIRPLADAVREAEQRAIASAYAAHDGNVLRTANALGIERNTLKRKLRAFGMYRPSGAPSAGARSVRAQRKR